MPSYFQRFIEYFKTHYDENDKEIIMGELMFRELFFENVTTERYHYSHVTKLMVHHGFLVMISKARYIISLDKLRSFTGVNAREKD